jgi:hypothetical protein
MLKLIVVTQTLFILYHFVIKKMFPPQPLIIKFDSRAMAEDMHSTICDIARARAKRNE